MNEITWLFSIAPLIAFACNFIVQIIVSRITEKVTLFVFFGLISGFILLISIFFHSEQYIIKNTLYAYGFSSVMTYLSLSFCYWGFLNLNRTSLRIRILRELFYHLDAGLAKNDLLTIYSPRELLNARLVRLNKNNKILKTQTNRWLINKKNTHELFALAKLLAFLRIIIMPAPYHLIGKFTE